MLADAFYGADLLLISLIEHSVVIVLGLLFGSFATAMIHRVPLGVPWAFPSKGAGRDMPRSQCPSCDHTLGVFDLIPVLSWAALRGRCRYCSAKIPVSYPLTELCVVLVCLLVLWTQSLSLQTAMIYLIIPFLAALLVIDLRHLILPNHLVFIVWAAGLIHHALAAFVFKSVPPEVFWSEYLMGSIVFALFVWGVGFVVGKVLKKDALGFGDVKFFGAAGMWLGLTALPMFCLLSGVIGVVFALLWRFIRKDPVFPFGPALIAAFYVLLLFDGSLLLIFPLK